MINKQIERITFFKTNKQEIHVLFFDNSKKLKWDEHGAPRREHLSPCFLNELWDLMLKHEMIPDKATPESGRSPIPNSRGETPDGFHTNNGFEESVKGLPDEEVARCSLRRLSMDEAKHRYLAAQGE